MNNYSIKSIILFYISMSAFFLILVLGFFVVYNHSKSLENDLMNKMKIMSEDIVKRELYTSSAEDLKIFFLSKSNNNNNSFQRYIKNINFNYVVSVDASLSPLSIIKKLPNGNYLIVSSSTAYIDQEINTLLIRLAFVLVSILGTIILFLHFLLKKLLSPLSCLVNYCHNSSYNVDKLHKCTGSYEVNSLREAILNLQGTNQKLCEEKEDIFKEAAHEIKAPIAILKARLSLFDKSDMPKDKFIGESKNDISTISNRLRELIFLKAIESEIKQEKEDVQMQDQCSMMQQLFKPILDKKKLIMISDLKDDFVLTIHRKAIEKVMQAIFENIFMHTKNGTIIKTHVDSKHKEFLIVNEIAEKSDEALFSSSIGTKLIERLSHQLEYEYDIHEKDGFYYTKIAFKGQKLS